LICFLICYPDLMIWLIDLGNFILFLILFLNIELFENWALIYILIWFLWSYHGFNVLGHGFYTLTCVNLNQFNISSKYFLKNIILNVFKSNYVFLIRLSKLPFDLPSCPSHIGSISTWLIFFLSWKYISNAWIFFLNDLVLFLYW